MTEQTKLMSNRNESPKVLFLHGNGKQITGRRGKGRIQIEAHTLGR